MSVSSIAPRLNSDTHGSTQNAAPEYNMTQERQIMLVDPKINLSIVRVLGLKYNGCEIPRHILGYDANWQNVFRKVRDFVKMDAAEQKIEKNRWGKFPRWEKDIYERRIRVLNEQKAAIHEKYAQVTIGTAKLPRSVSPVPEPVAQQASVATDNDTAGEQQVEPPSSVSDKRLTSAGLSESSKVFFRGKSRKRRSRTPASESVEQTSAPANDGRSSFNLKATSLFSPVEERLALVEDAEKVKKSRNTLHLMGTNAASLSQQADRTAIDSIHALLKKAGTAADTTHYPNRLDNEPCVRVVCLVLNGIEPSETDGGQRNTIDLPAKKPELLLVTHSGDDIKPVMQAFKAVTRSETRSNDAFHFYPLVAGKDGLVSSAVEKYIDAFKKSRRKPSKKPRAYPEVIEEL